MSHHYGEKCQEHSLEGIYTLQFFKKTNKQEAVKTEGERDRNDSYLLWTLTIPDLKVPENACVDHLVDHHSYCCVGFKCKAVGGGLETCLE